MVTSDIETHDLNLLYKQKKYEQLLQIVKSSRSIHNLYLTGLALYRLSKFDEANKVFNALAVLDKDACFYKPSLVGFCQFRQKKFKLASEYFRQSMNPKYADRQAKCYYFASTFLENGSLDLDKSDINLIHLVDVSSKYFLPSHVQFLLDLFYSIKLRKQTKEKSSTCYIMIHPLIVDHGLFENRNFSCDVLFIEQKYYYAYFMILTEDLIKKINYLIKDNHYKEVVLLGSSASAFFALVLASSLAKINQSTNFVVHAFSPQVEIDNNINIESFYHYSQLRKISKYSVVSKNIKLFGKINSLLPRNLQNITIYLYYGEKNPIDFTEAKKLTRLNLPYVHDKMIGAFPFHQSLYLYRYTDARFLESVKSMYVSQDKNSILNKVHIQPSELLLIKHTFCKSLSELLPLMG